MRIEKPLRCEACGLHLERHPCWLQLEKALGDRDPYSPQGINKRLNSKEFLAGVDTPKCVLYSPKPVSFLQAPSSSSSLGASYTERIDASSGQAVLRGVFSLGGQPETQLS